MKKILFISLTGMSEALGRSQVLEYLIDLSNDHKIYLLSFERAKDLENISDIKALTQTNNITWHYFIYSNRLGILSTIAQIAKAIRFSSSWIKENDIGIVHARSMIPATMGLLLKKMHGVKLLFDIRGFAIDEKVDSQRLRKGSLLFKVLKKLDDYLYKASDHIVTLTYAAKEILEKNLKISNKKITVIPTCASRDVFNVMNYSDKVKFKTSQGYDSDNKIILHTGTVSGWYDFESEVLLVKEMIRLDKSLHFLILNKNEQVFISDMLEKHSFPKDKVRVMSCSFSEVYKYLNIADCSLFFIKPSYSKQASAPTKFAENVACLLPSITNSGVGDMGYYLKQFDVGYVVDLASLEENIEVIAKNILEKINHNDFTQADFSLLFDEYFDKNIAINQYQAIYDQI